MKDQILTPSDIDVKPDAYFQGPSYSWKIGPDLDLNISSLQIRVFCILQLMM